MSNDSKKSLEPFMNKAPSAREEEPDGEALQQSCNTTDCSPAPSMPPELLEAIADLGRTFVPPNMTKDEIDRQLTSLRECQKILSQAPDALFSANFGNIRPLADSTVPNSSFFSTSMTKEELDDLQSTNPLRLKQESQALANAHAVGDVIEKILVVQNKATAKYREEDRITLWKIARATIVGTGITSFIGGLLAGYLLR